MNDVPVTRNMSVSLIFPTDTQPTTSARQSTDSSAKNQNKHITITNTQYTVYKWFITQLRDVKRDSKIRN